MKWTDSREIALALLDVFPDQNPAQVRFTDLMQWVMDLPEFTDQPEHCGERILEAIQMCWMDEYDPS